MDESRNLKLEKALDEGRKAVDILVDTTNPEALDIILQTMGSCLLGGPGEYKVKDGHYVARVFTDIGNPEYVKFALRSQGYAKVIGDSPELL